MVPGPNPADWVPYLDYDNFALNLVSNSIVTDEILNLGVPINFIRLF